jgi:hypothetical protein
MRPLILRWPGREAVAARSREMTYEDAIQMGGKDWQGKRVYFNSDEAKAALHGVEIKGRDGYKDGEKISRNNLFKITSSKPYFDVATGTVCGLVTSFHTCCGYAKI